MPSLETISSIITLVCDLLTASATMTVAYVAVRGMHTWREQMTGQDQYSVSKRILKGVFLLENLIQRIRACISREDTNRLWDRFDEVASELDTAFIEGRVFWGSELQKAKIDLKTCVSELRIASRMLSELNSKGSQLPPGKLFELKQPYEEVVWDHGPDDRFTAQLKLAVERVECVVRNQKTHKS